MKNIVTKVAVAAIAIAAITTTSCQSKYAKKCNLKNEVDSVSYSLGYFEAKGLGQVMERMPFDTVDMKSMAAAFANSQLTEQYLNTRREQFDTIDVEAFKHGFYGMLATGTSQIDEMVANTICQKKFNDVRARKEEERKAAAQKALAEGLNFLAENAKREGVTVTESGLQYEVVKMGEGAKPAETDRVKVLYTGKLIDGTVFDSTDNRNGEPATFGLKGVIKGWTEALQLMPVGSKWTIYVPAELAYGERGAGENIPGNSALIFDIELLEIVSK